MSLQPGDHLGPYEIAGFVGAGAPVFDVSLVLPVLRGPEVHAVEPDQPVEGGELG
jgi:hypothetical protein